MDQMIVKRRVDGTLIIPISVCYYSELHNAYDVLLVSSISIDQISIGCLDIIKHKQISLVKYYNLNK